MNDSERGCFRYLVAGALVAGVLVGWLGMRGFRGDQGSPDSPSPVPSGLANQTNFLLVGVTSLGERRATLLSAWLVTLQSSRPEIDFFPVYPPHPAMNLSAYAGAHPAITVRPEDLEAVSNLDVIAAHSLHWDVLLVLDESALNSLLEQVQRGGSTASEAALYASRPADPWDNPDVVRAQQENLIRYLCAHSSTLASPANRADLLSLLPKHAAASVDRPALAAFAESLAARQPDLECRFPLSETE